MSLPIEEFDYFSNPAIAEVEYFQPHDTIIVPFGGWQLGDSWLAIDHHGIMVIDKTSGKVVSDFTKKGGGPEEYVNILGLAVDNSAGTCHVLTSNTPTKIKNYSYDGEFLGEIQLPEKIHSTPRTFSIYNDSCYFVAVNSIRKILLGENDDRLVDKPYLLINRHSGEIQQLPVERIDPKICNRYVPKSPDAHAPNWTILMRNVAGGENRKIISEFSNDTIFVVENEQVVPIAVKQNWNKDYDDSDLVSVLFANDHYMIFDVTRKTTDHTHEAISADESKSGTFIYDMTEQKFHRYESDLFFESNGYLYRTRPIDKLMDAADKGQIKDPKLLDIIEKSNDESNWVWMIYHIKE